LLRDVIFNVRFAIFVYKARFASFFFGRPADPFPVNAWLFCPRLAPIPPIPRALAAPGGRAPVAAGGCGAPRRRHCVDIPSLCADSRWGESIAASFGCHVANYGVPGFGIDQALMRFEAVSNDTADVVVLSFFSEDIARHVTRNFDVWVYQPSHFGASVFAPKARYILGLNGELQYLPAQIMTFSKFEAAVRDPAQHIEHDYLAAGGASGLPIWRFPWTFTLARVFSHWKVRAKLAGLPWYGQLFLAGHPSQALEISTRIVERFVDVAQQRGKRPVIQLLPSILDFRHYSKSQTWPYQPLIDALASRDIEVHNLGEEMLEIINIEQACKLFDTGESSGLDDCGGHFNDLGYEILARHTAARIGAL